MAAKNFGRVNVSITASTGGLTAGLSRAGRQLSGFAGMSQGLGGRLTAMAGGFVGAGRGASLAAIGIKALGVAIKSLLAPLLIVTSLVSIFGAFKKAAGDLDEAGKTARRLGMSMTSFQTLSQVADEAGVSFGQLSTLLTVMTRQLGNLANGSTAAQAAFARIGLTLADLQNMAPENQFAIISQRIMALPTAAERTAAAVAIFGRQGAAAMGLIEEASSGAVAEIQTLREQLGLNLTDQQVKGIEMMNDAVSRLSLLFQGFINQFVAELAPAIVTVANLIVQFFAQNTQGWTVAQTLAYAFGQAIRGVVGWVTVLYGVWQVLSSFFGVFIAGALKAFETVTWAIENLIATMAAAAEAMGMTSVAESLRDAEQAMAARSSWAGQEAAIWGEAAATNFSSGIQNITNPLAAYDAEFANVTQQLQLAGAAGGMAAGETAAQAIAPVIGASTEALKGIVVGTSGGEEFRNSILRGADPRLEGDKNQERTADATERTADGVEDLVGELAGVGGLALATITV